MDGLYQHQLHLQEPPWALYCLATSKMGTPELFLPSEKITTDPSDCLSLEFLRVLERASPKAVFFPSSVRSVGILIHSL